MRFAQPNAVRLIREQCVYFMEVRYALLRKTGEKLDFSCYGS